MARVELARGYVFGEEPDSPLGRRLVVLEEPEGAAAAEDRLKALAQVLSDAIQASSAVAIAPASGQAMPDAAQASSSDVAQAWSDLRERVARPTLLVSADDEEELQAIQAFVLLLKGRLEFGDALEMERLIDMAMPALSGRPHPAVLDQARRNAEFRADFMERYDVLDAGQVHGLFGSKADNTAALAGRWRSAGKIFGVEHRGRLLYPAFQFDDAGRPKPVVAEILQALGGRGAWQVASWFTAPNGWLPDGRRPVDVMDADSDAVAAAAREVTRPNLF